MRKAGAKIRLEAYRGARLEQIRHNIFPLIKQQEKLLPKYIP
jgi:hypothetical protein